jgi:hypothetical protein
MSAPSPLKLKVLTFVWNRIPNCREMGRLSSRSFEQPLPLGTRIKRKIHFWICVWCKRYAEQIEFLNRESSVDGGKKLLFTRHILSDESRSKMRCKVHSCMEEM